ncbi:hypothetical protein ACW9UR_04750 [Halovulum sp. GXIMD14794]
MTFPTDTSRSPDHREARRGGAPVAVLDTLPPCEARAVTWLRLWCDGPEGQAQVWASASSSLGAGRATASLTAFERVLNLILEHGRRGLMRHSIGCGCVGADEAVFAQFLALTAKGEDEDAMMIASLLVRADMAPVLVGLGREAALGLTPSPARPGTVHPTPVWPQQVNRH